MAKGKKFDLSKRNSYVNKNAIKNNVTTLLTNPVYESKVDYTELNVTEEEKGQLVNYEQVIFKKQETISISLMEMSTALYNAQQILSKKVENGEGRFYSWFQQLNLSKSFVYRCLDKYKLYLISNIETVMDLTVKETAMITKALKDNTIQEDDVVEIISSDNIAKFLDEKINGQEEPTTVDIGSFVESTKEEQETEIKKIKKDIKSMNDDLKLKKEKMNELKEEINELKEKIKLMKEIEKTMKIEIAK